MLSSCTVMCLVALGQTLQDCIVLLNVYLLFTLIAPYAIVLQWDQPCKLSISDCTKFCIIMWCIYKYLRLL